MLETERSRECGSSLAGSKEAGDWREACDGEGFGRNPGRGGAKVGPEQGGSLEADGRSRSGVGVQPAARGSCGNHDWARLGCS